MKLFWIIVYNIFVLPILWSGFRLVGLFNKKIKRGIRGRIKLFDQLQDQMKTIPAGSKVIWFHASSLGEFEQAKPIIEELKNIYQDVKIAVSFFSPSGYEPSRKYKHADVFTYIPFDSYRNANKYINILNPAAAVMIRYDLWPNHVWRLKRRGIPVFLANATMRDEIKKNLPIAKSFLKHLYDNVSYILTVTQTDLNNFKKIGPKTPVIDKMGDTRYDQVLKRSIESRKKHLIPESILSGKKIIVVGSSWEEDEEVLFPVFLKLQKSNKDLLIIVVPHEPTKENLERIEWELNDLTTHIRFSDLNDYQNEKIIIVDSIGILMALYQYADAVFVGGGFGTGVHNILEPAVYGIPVLCGPNHQNSREAITMVADKSVFSVKDENEILDIFTKIIQEESFTHETGRKAELFIKENLGATQKFMSYFSKLKL